MEYVKPSIEMLTVSEVAHQLKVNPETVRRWAREGKVPAQRIGNMLFFTAEDVASHIAKAGNTLG